jgi:hypothetical protein
MLFRSMASLPASRETFFLMPSNGEPVHLASTQFHAPYTITPPRYPNTVTNIKLTKKAAT